MIDAAIGYIIRNIRWRGEMDFKIEFSRIHRIDFMVAGSDGASDHVVIVELKQWETCQATDRENVVRAFVGGAYREVAHPSQQAYSYVKLLGGRWLSGDGPAP